MNKKNIIVVLIVFLLFGVYGYATFNEETVGEEEHEVAEHSDSLASYEVSPAHVVEKVSANEEVILLDVRTIEEYETLHLQDALLLPVQELSTSTLASIGLGDDTKDKEIILYCRSGARSKTAYDIMKSLGYTNISSVAGGMVHWEEDGYPLTEIGEYTGPDYGVSADNKPGEENLGGPMLAVDRVLHDFGEILQFGGTVETTFNLTNKGSELLEIGTLTTSCSCTTATIVTSVLEPGDTTIMTVVFDPDLHEEPLDVFKRTVFIPTNDPNDPETEVSVQVDILEGK